MRTICEAQIMKEFQFLYVQYLSAGKLKKVSTSWKIGSEMVRQFCFPGGRQIHTQVVHI